MPEPTPPETDGPTPSEENAQENAQKTTEVTATVSAAPEVEAIPVDAEAPHREPLGGRAAAPVADTAPSNEGPKGGRGVWAGAQTTPPEDVDAEVVSEEAHQTGPIGGRAAAPVADTAPTNEGPKGGRGAWAGWNPENGS